MTKKYMRQQVKGNPILKKVLNVLLEAEYTPWAVSDVSIYFELKSENIKLDLVIYYDMDTRWSDCLKIRVEAKEEHHDVLNKNFKYTQHLQKTLNHLHYLNFISSYGRWIYRPQNLTVDYSYEMPIYDGKISTIQFKEMFGSILVDIEKYFYSIFKLAKTGKLPKSNDGMVQVYQDMI